MIYIGIDPGKKGGIGIIDGETASCQPLTEEGLISAIRIAAATDDSTKCCVEKVGAMPGQGVTSMFTFGKGCGFIEGVLRSFDIPYQLVPPQTWKKEFCLNSSKQTSIEVCRRLFPSVSLLPTSKCRVENDGMAEALLMAEYARRKL